MLQLAVPGLFISLQALSKPDAREFPALAMLHARGRRQALEAESIEELLCRQFGVARQTDWPIAAITYAFDDGRAGSDYWLRADPVHIQVHGDRLVLVDELAIPSDEAQILCDSLAAHFGDSFTPLPMQPDRWYMRIADDPQITTTPLSQVLGRHIDPLLPRGPGAMHWRKLLNEAQMLLFDHPVNHARESRGQLSINSLWLWGGGTLPAASSKPNRIGFYGCDFTARAVAKFSNAAVYALPEHWHAGINDNSLCLVDQLNRCWRNHDMSGWMTAMKSIESGWISPLIKSGRSFRIDDPVEGISLTWHPLDRWKFWRRPKAASPPEISTQIDLPEHYPGMDEFGNRYLNP